MSDIQKMQELEPQKFSTCYHLGLVEYEMIKANIKKETSDLSLAIEIYSDCQVRYPRAVKYFKLAAKNATEADDSLMPRNKLWRLYFQFANYRSAVYQLKKIIDSNRADLVHYFYRGLSCFTLGRYNEALLDFKTIAGLVVPDKYICRLQKDKEGLFYAISQFPDRNVKVNILFQALFEDTFWGRVFYYQRGYGACSLYKGMLRQIVAKLDGEVDIKKAIIGDRLSIGLLASLRFGQREELCEQLLKLDSGLVEQLGIIEITQVGDGSSLKSELTHKK